MSQTADRYAKALFELSKEQNNLEAVQDAMTDIRNLIVDLKDFRLFLNNPLLSYEERCVFLKLCLKERSLNLFLNFFYLSPIKAV